MKSVAEALEGLRSLPVSAAMLDAAGTIIEVNHTWKKFAKLNGLRTPNYGVGANYLKYCESDLTKSVGVAEQISDLISGKIELLTLIYPCDSPTEKRSFILIGVPLSTDKPTGVALLHVNLTEMLPTPMTSRSIRVGMARIAKAPSAINTDVVSGSVERSVVETLSSDLMEMFAGACRTPPGAEPPSPQAVDQTIARARLSRRQLEVLQLLGEGKTNSQIAAQLFRSPNTIKLHVSAILQRLDLQSRTQAALLASRLFSQPSYE